MTINEQFNSSCLITRLLALLYKQFRRYLYHQVVVQFPSEFCIQRDIHIASIQMEPPYLLRFIHDSYYEWQLHNTKKRETRLNSDSYFLRKCKKHRIIPRGLNICNPLTTTYSSYYAEQLCRRTSKKLMNYLPLLTYSRRNHLK